MPDESVIETLVNRQQVSKDINDTISEVERLVQALQNARNLRVQVSGGDKSTAELMKLSKELDVVAKNTTIAADAAIKEARARQENTKAIQEQNAARMQEIENLKKTGAVVSDVDRAQADAANSATALKIYKTELSQVQQELKLMDKVTSTAEKNTAAYRNKVSELTGSEVRLKNEISDLNKTIKQQNILNNSAAGSLDALKARYALLTREVDRLGVSERSGGIGKLLIAEASQVQASIKLVEGETGRFQRNVGNYSSAIGGFFKKSFGYFRQAANIIPGLGLSGLLLVIVDQFQNIFSSISGGAKAFDELKAKQEASKEITDKAIESYAKEITHLDLLKRLLKDDTVSRKEKIDAVKEYNKTADEANRIDEKSIDNSALIESSINRQIVLIKERALAKAAESVISEKAEALFLAQNSVREKALKANIAFQNSINQLQKQNRTGEVIKQTAEQQQRYVDDFIANDSKVVKAQKELDAALEAGFGLIGKNGDEFTKAGAKLKDFSEQERKAALELFKFRLGLQIQEQKNIQTYATGKDRVIARERQNILEKELIVGISKFELAQKDLTASQIKLINEKKTEDLRESDLKRLTDIQAFSEQERKIFEDNAHAQLKALEAAETERIKLRIEGIAKEAEAEINARQVFVNDELIRENDRYKLRFEAVKGNQKDIEKETKEHQQRIADIVYNATVNNIETQIRAQKRLLEVIDLPEEKRTEALQKISDLEKQLSDLSVKMAEDANAKKIKSDEDYFAKLQRGLQKALELYDQITSVVAGAFNAGATQRKNEIQDQINLIEKQKQADTDLINATVANRQDAAAEIAIIDARAQQRREQLEQRQKEIDIRKAQFDKAASVARIGIETPLAVVRALGDNTVPYPVRVGYAIAAGILGAAQLAVAIATPIPRYKYGTEYHPGGLAEVGHGKPEAIELPDGSIMKTPSTPTLIDLPEGTKVHPDYDKMMLSATITKMPTFNIKTDTNGAERAINKMSKAVVRAIKTQPQPIIKSDERWRRYLRKGHTFRTYLDNN